MGSKSGPAGNGSPRTGKRMLVTGADGMLGHEILARFRGEYDVHATDLADLDVTSSEQCRRVIGDLRPQVVVHCAAYTAVDRAESEEPLVFSVNADGTRNVARECRVHGSLLVTYGSDYIFDGTSRVPYREEDLPHPLSAYGRSKLAAEEALKEEGPPFLLIRTQWLYGVHGRNFLYAILEKAGRGEGLRVVSDQRGSPTSARDLAAATARLMEAGSRGTFHFSNEGETTWFDLASFVLSRAARAPFSLVPARTAELGYPAPRPAYSVLSKEKYRAATGETPRIWEEAAAEFLEDIRNGGR